ncbi:hypothetical protein M422DRAFT_57924 [Sphaerobolus stellatus SS14]|nr:hypothetical protein M422DRAFT_57924 [Sphaerobolus stellatus SS14]
MHEDTEDYHSDASTGTAVTNSSDEFWEDAAKEAGEVKAVEGATAKRGRWLYLAFLRLYRPFRVLIVAMLGCAVLITPYIVVRFAFTNSAVRPHVTAWSVWFAITWAAASVISILVDLAPRILLALVFYMFGKPPESLATELELFLAVTFWLKVALDSAALWITLSVVRGILKPPGSYWAYVNRASATIFVVCLIHFAEKCFLRFVSIRFHQKALADRLAENRLALKVLDRLATAQPHNPRKNNPYGRRKGHGHKSSPSGLTSRSASFDALNTNPNATKNERAAETIELMVHEANIQEKHMEGGKKRKKKMGMGASVLDQVADAISAVTLKNSKFHMAAKYTSVHSARKLARKLFSSLSDNDPPRALVRIADFYPYFPTREEAEVAFNLIDKDGNGDIERREMREAVRRIYHERKALTSSLKDVSSIVSKLDAVLVSICLVLVIFIALLIFDRANTLSSLVPLATIVLGFSFIFGHSAQVLFESLIFIFSTHVFDVGDLIMIDDQILFVKEFGLFSTTFRRVDGQEIVAPNSLLAGTKLIHNFRRSTSTWEVVSLQIAFNTSLEIVEQIKTRLKTYVTENSREWSDISVNIDKVEYQSAIYLNIGMQHKANWQDWGGRWSRRTAFMRHLKTLLEELEVGYTKPIQPVILHPSTLRSFNMSPSMSLRRRGGESRESGKDDLGNAGGSGGSSQGVGRVPGLTIDSEVARFSR